MSDPDHTTPRARPDDPAFTAIRARLDALETRQRQDADCMEAQAQRLDALQALIEAQAGHINRLESARIAVPVAPESAVTASGVSVEPGNATEAHGPRPIFARHPDDHDVAAALRMYRKVQGCEVVANSSLVRSAGRAPMSPQQLLAWLKEGEA